MKPAWILLVVLFSPPAWAQSDAPSGDVRGRAFVEEIGDIAVGQLFKLWVEVTTDNWFTSAPRYPDLVLPGAIALMPEQLGVNLTVREGGKTRSGQRQRYAVIPQRPGVLEVPPIEIRLTVAVDGKPSAPLTVITEPLRLAVVVPEAARGIAHLVSTSRLEVTQRIDHDLTGLRVGDGFSRAVTVIAGDSLSLALPPVTFDGAEGLSVYPAQPRLSDSVNRGRYSGERTDSATYVLEAVGTYALPKIVVQWWDPEREMLERHVLPAVAFSVAANPDLVPQPPVVSIDAGHLLATALEWLRSHVIQLSGLAGLVYLGHLAWQHWRAPVSAAWPAWRGRWKARERRAFRAFGRTARGDDSEAMIKCFWRWLDCFAAADATKTWASILRATNAGGAGEAIDRYVRARYGRLGQSALPAGRDLYRSVRSVRDQLLSQRRRDPSRTGGRGLNPRSAELWLLVIFSVAFGPSDAIAEDDRPDYVTAAVCKGCHEDAYRRWSGSHHAWALQPPTPETVFGDFDDVVFEHGGKASRFFRRDGQYVVETEGPNGDLAVFEITYTVGVEPLQQYLVTLEGGRLQALDIAWDRAQARWFHLYPDQQTAPDDALHWTGAYKNWNGRCADCHSTNFVKGYDPQRSRFDSRWSDINVACEACHGPGQDHVAWASGKIGKFSQNDKGLPVVFDSAEAEINLCASCHSRRQALRPDSHRPGEAFLDGFRPALLREGLYHPDGQILDEVYVYGSFLQSKMYAAGVRCSDCHIPHSLGLRAEGSELCVTCHNPDGNARFPSLRKAAFDTPAHHHHEVGSAGADCANCHMPARSYMIVDPRRDHSFRVPRPDLSPKLGTPNACAGCHADRDDAWADQQVARWYPDGRNGTRHYGTTLAAGRAVRAGANLWLGRLAADRSRPAIVRATALDLMRGYGPGEAEAGMALLSDPSPSVRLAAARLQQGLPPQARAARLAALLEDPRRLVRIEAARLLIDVPISQLPQDKVPAFRSAVLAYQESLLATVDFPETQLNLAQVAYRTGNLPAAERALSTAIELDPYLGQAWVSLGELLHERARPEEAKSALLAGLAKLPDFGPLHRALGLLRAELGDLPGAAVSLARATTLQPQDARLRYNLGLTLDRLGRRASAEQAFRAALALAPNDPEILYALGLHLLRRGYLQEARGLARRLLADHPGFAPGRDLDRAIRQRL